MRGISIDSVSLPYLPYRGQQIFNLNDSTLPTGWYPVAPNATGSPGVNYSSILNINTGYISFQFGFHFMDTGQVVFRQNIFPNFVDWRRVL